MGGSPVLAVDDASWMMCLGGQGGAAGWSVRCGDGRRPITIPDATHGRSSFTVFVLTWGDGHLPIHPVVGTPAEGGELGELEVAGSGLVVEHPVLETIVPDVPHGRYLLSYASFVADAVSFGGRHGDEAGTVPEPGDHGSSVVTIWAHLRPETQRPETQRPETQRPGTQRPETRLAGTEPTVRRSAAGDGQLIARLDELGLILADPPEVDRILEIHRDEVARHGGLLEAMETTYLGEELVDSGAFIPLWGMRPWVYRVATAPGTASLCPIGEPAGAPIELAASPFAGGARLVPGGRLRGTCRVDWRRWPLLSLPGTGEGLRIQAFVGCGSEPLMHPFSAGIVATVWVERTLHAPSAANSSHFPRPDFNPLEWVSPDHRVQRVRRYPAGDASGTGTRLSPVRSWPAPAGRAAP